MVSPILYEDSDPESKGFLKRYVVESSVKTPFSTVLEECRVNDEKPV